MNPDISALRLKSQLTFSNNLFSKNELKNIFIVNYPNVFVKPSGANVPGITLNNNQSYQCFRNAAFYFMYRMRAEIWNNIDNLNMGPVASMSDSDFNLYLITQTFIELMDDQIINRVIPGSDSIQKKRTTFIDSRFDQLKGESGLAKYSFYGLLSYNQQRKQQVRQDFVAPGMLKNINDSSMDSMLNLNINGGVSQEVLDHFLTTRLYFSNANLLYPIKELTNISTISTNPNYIMVNMSSQPKISDFITNIHNYVDKTNANGINYKLVGILYDCLNGVPHQISSVCFGDNCNLPTPKHIFMDDHHKNVMDLSNPFDLSKLKWGCAIETRVTYLLYESDNAVTGLKSKIDSYLAASLGNHSNSFQIGGDYYQKYLKYKNKYIELKNKIQTQ
jgi:hypothetical protein